MAKLIELFKESTPEGAVAASKAQVGHALGLGLGLGSGLGFGLGLGLGSGLGLERPPAPKSVLGSNGRILSLQGGVMVCGATLRTSSRRPSR